MGASPHKLMYNFKLFITLNLSITLFIISSFNLQVNAEEAISFTIIIMKKYYNKTYKFIFFKSGNKVYLKLYKEYIIALIKMLRKKFIQQYIDSFIIFKRVGQLAYQLKLPSLWNIHPIISIMYLKSTLLRKNSYK